MRITKIFLCLFDSYLKSNEKIKTIDFKIAYAELNEEIENHYNHAETPTVTREEIDKKTREAAIRLGYIME